jgi:uncharacterized membrane protein
MTVGVVLLGTATLALKKSELIIYFIIIGVGSGLFSARTHL